jgi:hypothetical protein
MPYMGFPLDVWSAKIFHTLFFGKEPQNPEKPYLPSKRLRKNDGATGGVTPSSTS